MTVDTSAIPAILFNEPDAATYAKAIADAEIRRISAATTAGSGTGMGYASRARPLSKTSTPRNTGGVS